MNEFEEKPPPSIVLGLVATGLQTIPRGATLASENIWCSSTTSIERPTHHLNGPPGRPSGVFDIPLSSARVRRVHLIGFGGPLL
jgi:hypothetical protein